MFCFSLVDSNTFTLFKTNNTKISNSTSEQMEIF